MTKAIFKKIILNAKSEEAFNYAHSKEYREKRIKSEKKLLSLSSIRGKRPAQNFLKLTIG